MTAEGAAAASAISAGSSKYGSNIVAAPPRQTSILNLEKRSALLEEYHQKYQRPEDPTANGRKTPPQPHHFDLPKKTLRAMTPPAPPEPTDEDKDNDPYRFPSLKSALKMTDGQGMAPNGKGTEPGAPREREDRPRTPPQPHHYDLPEKHLREHDDSASETDRDEDERFHHHQRRPNSSSTTSSSHSKRTGSGRSSAERPSSGRSLSSTSGIPGMDNFDVVIPPKTAASPHHSGTADKTIFPPGSRPSSRPWSGGSDQQPGNRPKTPVAPHHYDSVERTMKPQQDSRLPRLARTGRVPEEYTAVGKMVLNAGLFFLGDQSVTSTYVIFAILH